MVVTKGGKVCRPEVAGHRDCDRQSCFGRVCQLLTVNDHWHSQPKSPLNYSYANAWNALRDTESRTASDPWILPSTYAGPAAPTVHRDLPSPADRVQAHVKRHAGLLHTHRLA